uniref:Uncharacterized protein MANES_07G140200 n=1 Tax=Rhizophora mucronata TaxID=61149 RepID=A0A2P2MG45_RHIMU
MEDIQKSSLSSVLPSSLLERHPLSVDSELWLMAEQRTGEILCTIEPVLASEQKRREVIDYIQRLIQGHFGTKVYPLGSVPLKTYLPHGDIDLTILTYENMEEDLARDVCFVLMCAEQYPQFQVKDVHYVQAKVKIVKCFVSNIPVDISFNQMAGLCALFFLEQVDQVAGKDHIVKRSIILIKAWCLYESRILGACHGLISTYALEIMIVHIIDLFHSSLPGPLAVLWRFLDYYSTFDWDNYCVSINGPTAISSLPEVAAGSPENTRNCLLLGQEFLQNFREHFSVPIKAPKNAGLQFPVKHLNIMDPLKEGNNLGRSVSRANFHRIRCALTLGAQSLREILMLPAESIGTGLEKFFVNTLDRNGRGERPDVPVPVPAFGTGRSEVSDLCGDYSSYSTGLLHSQWQNVFSPKTMDVLVPRMPFCHLYTLPLYAAPSGFDNMGRSQGTGTYIPDATQHHYSKKFSTVGTRKSSSLTQRKSLKSSQKIGQVEDSLDFSMDQVVPVAEKSNNGNWLALSLNQFPLLPFTEKPMPSEIQSCEQPSGNAPEDRDCTVVLEGIEFGTFRCSALSPELPSSVAMQEAGSKGSTSLETMLAIPKVFMQMKQQSGENDGQMYGNSCVVRF